MLGLLAQAANQTYWWEKVEAANRAAQAGSAAAAPAAAAAAPAAAPVAAHSSAVASSAPVIVAKAPAISPHLANVRPATDNLFEIITNVFSRGDTLAHPQALTANLASLSVVWAVVLLAAGLVCLLNGYRIYKSVIIVMGLAIGAFAGYYMGKQIQAAYIVAGCLAILLAVGCWPMMKYAVAAFGGLAGAFVGANAWAACARLMQDSAKAQAMAENYWIGALIGLLLFGLLAFIVFKLSVVLFTSVSGSTFAVLGGVALLLQVPAWKQPVSESLSSHPVVVPLLIVVPAVIGLIMQHSRQQAAAGNNPGAAPAGDKKK